MHKEEKKIHEKSMVERFNVSRTSRISCKLAAETVQANDCNLNTVAHPEMRLLELSIKSDGFTLPIVCWQTEDHYELIDGFHRYLVGKKLGMTHWPNQCRQ